VSVDYTKYKLRTCRTLLWCEICGDYIRDGETYFDGGYSRRAHENCALIAEDVKEESMNTKSAADLDDYEARLELVETRYALARAHAAIEWFATVRAAITSGATKVEGEDALRGLVNILAVAHALTEVWLSGEPVTARAVADLLGWHAEHSALAVREWLRPLQTGPYPPLVLDDLRPSIAMLDGDREMWCRQRGQ
jgi:hypothetical protein